MNKKCTYTYFKYCLFLVCFFNAPLLGAPKVECPENVLCPTDIPCISLRIDYLNNPKSPYYNTDNPHGYFVSSQFGYAIFSKPSFKVESVDIVTPTAMFIDLGCDPGVCTTQLRCTYNLHYKEHHKKNTSPYTLTSVTTTNNN